MKFEEFFCHYCNRSKPIRLLSPRIKPMGRKACISCDERMANPKPKKSRRPTTKTDQRTANYIIHSDMNSGFY